MRISIYSLAALEALLPHDLPENAAIIRFSSPEDAAKPFRRPIPPQIPFFEVVVPDIDLQILPDFGYTYETYLQEADALAEFIREAHGRGLHLICQCDYGQSRSAACAAAILQHFEGRGIDIFADYRYYPNQLVYHKIFDALQKQAP